MSERNIDEIMPRVSVCVPAYNNPEEVARLIKSLLVQDFTDWELIVTDDSGELSSGQTGDAGCGECSGKRAPSDKVYETEVSEVVHDLCADIPEERLIYRHNTPPLGHVINWNAALKYARGEFVKIMFSDDFFTDERSLGRFVAMLEEDTQADLAFSGSRQVYLGTPDGKELVMQQGAFADRMEGHTAEGFPYYDRCASDRFIEGLKADYRYLFTGDEIGAPSAVIIRRRQDGTIPYFDEDSGFASDMFLYFRAFTEGRGAFTWTDRPLVCIGVHGGQYTETFSERDERIYRDMRLMYERFGLKDAGFCRKHFTRKYLVRYHRSIGEGVRLGISPVLILCERMRLFVQSALCFMQNRIRKCCRRVSA